MSSDDTGRTVLQGGIVVRKLLDNILSLAFAGYMILLIYFLFFSEEYGFPGILSTGRSLEWNIF